jgi:hypothetical protein
MPHALDVKPKMCAAVLHRVMCRDELLLKVAILGLVSLDATPQHMATLLQCYRGRAAAAADGARTCC